MELTRLRPTAYGRRSELTQSATSGRSGLAALGRSLSLVLPATRSEDQDWRRPRLVAESVS